jgi:hypothetical protein
MTPTCEDTRDQLRQLFNSAAAMSLAVINQDDAEPEMARFLHMVKSHPDQHPFVVQLFVDSFAETFHMHWEPWQFLQFCMHDLRWHELRDFIRAKWDLYFPRLTALSGREGEQPIRDGLNFFGGDPRVLNGTQFDRHLQLGLKLGPMLRLDAGQILGSDVHPGQEWKRDDAPGGMDGQ